MNTVKDLMSLKGRRALITGAVGGLGKVMAETLAELGANLVLIDRPGTDFDPLTQTITDRWDVEVQHFHCDLELQVQRSELMTWVNQSGAGLNILINNAFVGTSSLQGWGVPFEAQTVETWRRALEVNLTAVFDLCQGLTPLLKQAKGACIINIASIYGLYGPDWSLYEGTTMSNPAAYSASKGGLIQFTRWLATTVAPNIRVNSVSPGGIYRNQPDEFVKRYEAKTPLGRMATENDFRGVIAYLASDLSEYVTGQKIEVDGGWGSMVSITEIAARIKFWHNTDRIGPDILLTHWRLYFKSTMKELCKNKFKHFGNNSEFRPGAYAEACSKISIGDNVVIRPGTFLFADPTDGGGCISIEDKVSIGSGVHFYTNNHKFSDINIPIYDQGYPKPTASDSITLKKGCWIGAGAIILPGVEVGENAVIGAGTVVTKSVPPKVVFLGNPGKIIRRLNQTES